ncbi:organic solute transporter subunit beta [Bombina bombina]|uniref:organic solute transporter subunit beta n=1 Tax=Bombina bombina TaxID=8345 RepID=UPI00235AB972|nr:organic solute transporter subunit beta [Bombina bombina]XP_053573558.1 organic solute transporter subunit beta [Bombina bombina]
MSDVVATTPSPAQKKLQRAVWFFRTGDLTAWNYAILALSFVGLFLGLYLLSRNIMGNKRRKLIAMYQKADGDAESSEVDNKQAIVNLEKGDPTEDSPLKKEPGPGDITVQWKDGQITSLYTETPEADV